MTKIKKLLIYIILISFLLFTTSIITIASIPTSFVDVSPTSWYYKSVQFASSRGIMIGDQNKFRPNDYTTRAELVSIIKRIYDDIQCSENKFIEKIPFLLQNSVRIDNNGHYGSGIALNNKIILTANHVVETDEVNILTYQKDRLDGKVIKRDTDLDLALIEISEYSEFNEITITEKANSGQSVLIIGNPSGLNFSLTKGIISNITRYVNDGNLKTYIQINASLNPGNSGGGVFDEEGNLVGIVSRAIKENDTEGIGYVVGYYKIKGFVNIK